MALPIYEYRCNECRRRVTLYWRSFSEIEETLPRCTFCGGEDLTRLVSRVAVLRSEESRLDDLADPSSLAGLDENDPQSMARWMRKMSREMGEDLGPEFDEVVDRLEAGQSPEEIEKVMPDLGGDLGAGDEF
ncbi:MAG: zinc ribbon domain-containing protein [Chloroflexi bacterium]|nr:zinc ribbon domain-containing protein [Chloroflexota bacterium]